MRSTVALFLLSLVIFPGCSDDTPKLPQGSFGLPLESIDIQQKFDRMVTGNTEIVYIRYDAAEEPRGFIMIPVKLKVVSVFKTENNSLCKTYHLSRLNRKYVNAIEVGHVCKNDNLTDGKWVTLDSWKWSKQIFFTIDAPDDLNKNQ